MMRTVSWFTISVVIGAGVTPACGPEDAPDVEAIVPVSAVGHPPLGMIVDRVTSSVTVFDSGTSAVLGTVGGLGGAGLLPGDCSIAGTKGYFAPRNSNLTVIDLAASPPTLAGAPNPFPAFNRGDDTALSPDGKFMVVCGANGRSVMVYDLATQNFVNVPQVVSNCSSVDVCSNGSVLITQGNPGAVRRLRIDAAGNLTDTGESQPISDPRNVYCSPSGRSGMVMSASNGVATAFNVTPLFPLSTLHIAGVAAGAFNRAGNRAYLQSGTGLVTAVAYDQTSAAFGSTLFQVSLAPPEANLFGSDTLAVHPSDASIYVSQPGGAQILDAGTGARIGSITSPSLSTATGVCFGPFRPNRPPVARCADRTVVADGTCHGQASIDNGSFDPDTGDTFTCTQTPGGGLGKGTTSATLTCTDGSGESSSCTATVTVADRTPPGLVCPADQVVECNGGHGDAAVSFAGAATDRCDGDRPVSCMPGSGATFALGTTIDVCTASDGSGNTSQCGHAVTVVDTAPPELVAATPPPVSPADHAYRRIGLGDCIASIADACRGPLDIASHATVIGCVSDEPETGPGDDTTSDCVIVDGNHVDLRAERADNGDGRTYSIFYTATDGGGNAAVHRCTVDVPL